MSKKARKPESHRGRQAAIELTREEVADLVRLARHYEKTMGVSRFFVRFISGAEMKSRFRFVEEESAVLEQFARSVLTNMEGKGQDSRKVTITPRALLAFWGRALSSLQSSRSRRRLSPARLALRTTLEGKLQDAVTALHRESPAVVDAEVSTRRERETRWMQERLASREASAAE